jgi:hypothetical protein
VSHQFVSMPNMYISAGQKSLICCTRMSMHKWFSSVCSSASHSVVWATVAALNMVGIVPRSSQAYALPDTIQSLLPLATVKNRVYAFTCYVYTMDLCSLYNVYTIILCKFNTYEWYILKIYWKTTKEDR